MGTSDNSGRIFSSIQDKATDSSAVATPADKKTTGKPLTLKDVCPREIYDLIEEMIRELDSETLIAACPPESRAETPTILDPCFSKRMVRSFLIGRLKLLSDSDDETMVLALLQRDVPPQPHAPARHKRLLLFKKKADEIPPQVS